MTLEELMQKILEILVRKKRHEKQDLVEAREIARELNIDLDDVHEALDRMELFGWIKLIKTFGPTYTIEVTTQTLLTYDSLGKSKKPSIGFKPPHKE